MTRESLVSIFLNRTLIADAQPLLLVPRLGPVMHISDFEKLGLIDPKIRIAIRGEEDYVPLSRVVGLTTEIDLRKLELKIQAEPKLLKPNFVAGSKPAGALDVKANWGAFLNYDLLGYRSSFDKSYGGNLETVLFSPHGSLVSNFSLLKGESSALGAIDRNVRLETYYQYDMPDKLWRMRVGDSISNTGSWGRAVRFAGVKFGTDFSLNPNLVTLPLLQLGGSLSVPSSVDLFINNSLQRNFSLPAGPFTIDQIPVVTGSGNARLVVRNNLGQDQVIEVPFFRVPLQLAKGLSDYDVELGAIRRNFGLTSNDYGQAVGSATWRYGVSESLTSEVRAEALKGGERTLGLAAVASLPAGFSVSPGIVSSQSAAGTGGSGFLNLSYSGQAFRVNIRAEGATEGFRQVGFGPTEIAFARRNTFNAGLRLSRYSDLGLTYIDNLSRSDGRQRIMSMNFGTRIVEGLYASTTFNRTLAGNSSNSLSMSFNWIGQSNNSALLNAQASRQNGLQNDLITTRYAQRPDVTGGYGYELEAGSHQRARVKAEVLGDSGQLTAEATRLSDNQGNATRLTARGAVVFADGAIKTSRVIDDSFLLIKAPEVPGAKVSRGGGRQVTLDKNGRAVVERVQAYAANPIAVVAATLPIDASVGKLENRVAVPSKAGRVVDLAIKRNRSVTIKLIFGGKVMTSGATVEYAGQRLPVGYDGLVYVVEIGKGGIGKVVDGAAPCQFELKVPANEELIPDLGEIECTAK